MSERPKCISYSLFGYERARHESCFDFNSYLRGLMINIRMNRLIFPGWRTNLQTDKATHEAWGKLFDRLDIDIEVHQNDVPLTLAMLWRLRPAFDKEGGVWKYSHVLCRDLDSPATYREAQAVQYWINRDKALHAITDSVSHNLPLLGGMIGVRPDYFTERMGVSTWKNLININPSFKWEQKGSDQWFLNDVVYPRFASQGSDSITQHYFLGMPNTFLSDFKTCGCPSIVGHESHCINNIEIDIPFELKESNSVCGHIGAAGYYETALFKFLRRYWNQFDDLLELEAKYPTIFYWANGS